MKFFGTIKWKDQMLLRLFHPEFACPKTLQINSFSLPNQTFILLIYSRNLWLLRKKSIKLNQYISELQFYLICIFFKQYLKKKLAYL